MEIICHDLMNGRNNEWQLVATENIVDAHIIQLMRCQSTHNTHFHSLIHLCKVTYIVLRIRCAFSIYTYKFFGENVLKTLIGSTNARASKSFIQLWNNFDESVTLCTSYSISAHSKRYKTTRQSFHAFTEVSGFALLEGELS